MLKTAVYPPHFPQSSILRKITYYASTPIHLITGSGFLLDSLLGFYIATFQISAVVLILALKGWGIIQINQITQGVFFYSGILKYVNSKSHTLPERMSVMDMLHHVLLNRICLKVENGQ